VRVALFTETYLPYINGVVTHVKILKDGLERLGHTVLVVTADPTTHRHYIKDGVLYCPATRLKKLYNYGVAVPLSQTRLRMVENFKPDVIHIHNEFGIGLSGLLIARRLHVPMVYTLHTMYDEYIYYVAPHPFYGLAKQVSHKYMKFIAQQASALTGPSKKCEQYFQQVGLYKKVHVIPNAVELGAFMPENIDEEKKVAFRRDYGIDPDQMLACFVGRLGREKSVDVLLDYWAQVIRPEDRIHLLIVGDGPCRVELEQQAQALGIRDMVTFTGAVLHDKLPPYLASCDVYVTASLSDTNSISMLEGMATGLPVLQRLDPLNEDQVREGENGFVFNSPQELAAKLKLIKNLSPEQLAALKAKVNQSVKQSGAETLARNTLAVYESILPQ